MYQNATNISTQARSEAGRLLAAVALTDAAGRRSGAYSGGMQRRLRVAIALLGDPQLVVMDEPTRGACYL